VHEISFVIIQSKYIIFNHMLCKFYLPIILVFDETYYYNFKLRIFITGAATLRMYMTQLVQLLYVQSGNPTPEAVALVIKTWYQTQANYANVCQLIRKIMGNLDFTCTSAEYPEAINRYIFSHTIDSHVLLCSIFRPGV